MVIATLFDLNGKVLASFNQSQPFKIENMHFEANIQADGSLRLCRSTTTDSRDSTFRQTVYNLKDELCHRQKDLSMIEKDVALLTARIQEGEENAEALGMEMTRMLVLKGQHKKKIREIQNQTTVCVNYQQIKKKSCVTLYPGLFTLLPWFSKPVMWCTEKKEDVQETTTMRTEEICMRILEEMDVEKGHIYAVGGRELFTAERYDPDQNGWTKITSMCCKRSGPGVATIGSQLYVVGGYDGSSRLKSGVRYDPRTKIWSAIAAMSSKRAHFGLGVIQGKLYAVGGRNGFEDLSSVERYDPGQDKWTTVAPLNSKRCNFGMAVMNGYLYAVGGRCGSSRSSSIEQLSTVERYDPMQNKWINIIPMRCKRDYPGVAVLGNMLYVLGGSNLSSVERYDPLQDKWSPVTPMGSKRRYLGAAAIGGYLYAIGGHNGVSRLKSVERYNPRQNNWLPIVAMNNKRSCSGVVVISA